MLGFSLCIFTILINFIVIAFCQDLKGFDDSVLYKINWPGKSDSELLDPHKAVEPYLITTANKEKYECFVPNRTESEWKIGEEYTGPNPLEILYKLFNKNTCSYRLEPYWTYELCHGRYVRQYHEERDGKKVKVQEYDLGTFDVLNKVKFIAEYGKYSQTDKKDIPTKKVEGVNVPYVEIEMTEGTTCDLNGKPRSIKLLYVCYQHSKLEIYSLKETSTCEYEAIVLTPLLCSHPDYRPQDMGENEIDCRPVGNAAKKPRAMMTMEAESFKLRHQKVTDEMSPKVYTIRVDKDSQDGETRVRVEIHPIDTTDKTYISDAITSVTGEQGVNLAKVSPIHSFLGGNNCLFGGNGWWKYEFCYGQYVTQYHKELDGRKTVLNLGKFDKQKHMEWIDANPQKKPKPFPQRKQLSHFYTDGSMCAKTGKLRQTEVKLKCVLNSTASPTSISLYLLEPKTCEYILGVESALICEILELADDSYGLISEKNLLNIDRLSSPQEEDDERIANEDE